MIRPMTPSEPMMSYPTEWPTIDLTEPTGDCYEIDTAPSGESDPIWYVLEELAADIVDHGGRWPENLWRQPGDGSWPTSMLPALDRRVTAMRAEDARYGTLSDRGRLR